MKPTLMILLLLLPAVAVGQSLSEVAKQEKQRRERNKVEGKKALIISEQELFPEQAEGGSDAGDESGSSTSSSSSRSEGPPRPRSDGEREYDEEREYEREGDVPTNIPPDLSLEERLEMFDKMKRHYTQQVKEIDQAIAENNERIRQLEAKIGATSAMGGAGLPVAPQTGTGVATTQMTGQESQSLIAERDRLTAMNDQMNQRKEGLKLDLQTKGRVAGIPAGYLRF